MTSVFQPRLLGIPTIHLEQVTSEQGGFVTTGAGADFHHATRSVTVFAADGQVTAVLPKAVSRCRADLHLRFGHLAFFGVLGRLGHFLAAADFVGQSFELAILVGDLGQTAMLARSRTHPGPIRQDLGV